MVRQPHAGLAIYVPDAAARRGVHYLRRVDRRAGDRREFHGVSFINALLLQPLPFKDPQQLVWIANGNTAGLSGQTTQVNHLLDLRRTTQSFSDVAAYFAFYGVGDNVLTGDGPPERLSAVPVSENFFKLLGVEPLLGRTFTADECKWQGRRR
jgi:hypothetical protein